MRSEACGTPRTSPPSPTSPNTAVVLKIGRLRRLEATAATFHKFYDSCRVLPQGDEAVSDLHRARLLLVGATRIVFANGLGMLGVTAPERM